MNLGDKIKDLRETLGLTQGQLAGESAVSQGYLSQLESGDVKNPSAAVLLLVVQAMQVNPDDLFEAAGYPTTRTLRQVYEDYEANVDPDLLRYLGRLSRNRQRRLLFLLEGMENLVDRVQDEEDGQQEEPEAQYADQEIHREDVTLSSPTGHGRY